MPEADFGPEDFGLLVALIESNGRCRSSRSAPTSARAFPIEDRQDLIGVLPRRAFERERIEVFDRLELEQQSRSVGNGIA